MTNFTKKINVILALFTMGFGLSSYAQEEMQGWIFAGNANKAPSLVYSAVNNTSLALSTELGRVWAYNFETDESSLIVDTVYPAPKGISNTTFSVDLQDTFLSGDQDKYVLQLDFTSNEDVTMSVNDVAINGKYSYKTGGGFAFIDLQLGRPDPSPSDFTRIDMRLYLHFTDEDKGSWVGKLVKLEYCELDIDSNRFYSDQSYVISSNKLIFSLESFEKTSELGSSVSK